MRAISGEVVSSKPCSLREAILFLESFSKSAASHLPSSDCNTYLRNAAEAIKQLCRFRDELGGRHQQGAANFDAHDYEGPVEGDRRHQAEESKGYLAVHAGGSHRVSAAGIELDVASGKKKGKQKRNGDLPEDRAAARADSIAPSSPEIATEKRKKKDKHPNDSLAPASPEIATEKRKKKEKEKHPNKEIVLYVKPEPTLVVKEEQELSLVVREEPVSEKKKSKKKKEKDYVKLEEDVNEVDEKIVNDSAAEQGVASREKRRKKKKHEQEEDGAENVKEEEKTVTDGDLDMEKRKKKRGRGDDYDNAQEQVEHRKKKQKKHS